jgi:hypothetical protein
MKNIPTDKNLLYKDVDLYPSENLNAWNLPSVRHFVYKLLFHVHLPRFGNILIWIDCRKIVVKVFHIWH